MTEDFLHYVWKHQLFKKEHLITDQNEKVEIILPGTHNTDAGPDFTNARIKLGSTIWAGNIEIHIDSASWIQHKHNKDQAYDNVILHIVYRNNGISKTTKNRIVPTLEIEIDKEIIKKYSTLKYSSDTIACKSELSLIDNSTLNIWFETLRIERLKQKAIPIIEQLNTNKGHWEECFYTTLATTFGMKTNALPFELLTKSTPLKLINKYHHNLFQLEALLFGQSGFLETPLKDTYHTKLRTEYLYLKKIHNLTPIKKHLWKFLRLRPANFPTIRLAQFASLINKSDHLFSKIIETESITKIQELLNCSTSIYWTNHYNFTKESSYSEKRLGISTINSIIINTIIPFIFIYGKERHMPQLSEKALEFQEQLPAEKNKITQLWKNQNKKILNSSQSQAIIQLIKNYCSEKNCLYCQIGNAIIQKRINEAREI